MFSECDLLSKIILPNSITMIGYEAFRECTNIESIVLPNSIIQIEPYAFAICIYNHRTTKTNQKYPSVNL